MGIYTDMLPDHVLHGLKAISDKTRLDILFRLIDEGEHTFVELRKGYGMVVSDHMKWLVDSSLVRNYYKKIPERRDMSFYNVSNFGRELGNAILKTIERFYAKTSEEEQETPR